MVEKEGDLGEVHLIKAADVAYYSSRFENGCYVKAFIEAET